MGLFKKKNRQYSIKDINEESYNINLVPYICDGEKFHRVYYGNEIEAIKQEAYEQGYKEACRYGRRA